MGSRITKSLVSRAMISRRDAMTSRIGILALGLLLTLQGNAAQGEQAAKDLIEPYPRAEVVETAERKVVDYRMATGAARRVDGNWAPERELRKAGELSKVTMQIPGGHGPEEVFDYYRQRLATWDARALFLCNQRNCGSSNSWANDLFEVKQLYGLDQHQYYGIFELVDDEDELSYLALYTVRRGNQRIYAHLELLETQQGSTAGIAPNPNAIVQQLNEQGYYSVSGLQLENTQLVFQQDHIESLAQAIRSNRRLSLRIVGHDYRGGSLSEERERSEAYARQLAEKLVATGVQEDRLEAHGVGSLVPMRITGGKRDKDFRVELVVVQ